MRWLKRLMGRLPAAAVRSAALRPQEPQDSRKPASKGLEKPPEPAGEKPGRRASDTLVRLAPRSASQCRNPIDFVTDPVPLVAPLKRLPEEPVPGAPWVPEAPERVTIGRDDWLREQERAVQEKFSLQAGPGEGAGMLSEAEVCWGDEELELGEGAEPSPSDQLVFDFGDPLPGDAVRKPEGGSRS